MQRVEVPKKQAPQGFGRVIEGPKLKQNPPAMGQQQQRPESGVAEMRRGAAEPQRRQSEAPRQQAPAKSSTPAPVLWASGVSVLWIVVCAVFLANLEVAGGIGSLNFQSWVLLILAMVTPLPLIALVTYIMLRAGDLRRSALILGRLTKELLRPDQAAAKDMNTLGAAIRAEVDMVTASLDEAVRRVNALEGVLRAQTKALEDATGDVDTRTRGISHTLEQQQSKIDNLVKTLSKEARMIGETIDSHAGAIIAATSQAGDQLKSAQVGLDERTQALDKVAKQAVRGAHEAAKGLQDETLRLDTVSEAALERASKLTSRYEAQHRALSKAAADMARENAHLDRVLENHRTLLGQIAEVTAAQAKRIEDTVSACVGDLDKAMEGADKKTAAVSDSFIKTIERLTLAGEKAAETMSSAATAARDAAKEAESDLGSSSTRARASLEAQLEQARAALTALSEEAGTLIDKHSDTAIAGLDKQLAKLKEAVDGHVDSTGESIKSLQKDLTETLQTGQKTIEHLAAGAGESLDQAVGRAIEKLQTGQKTLEEMASGTGDSLEKAVAKAITKMQGGQKSIEQMAEGAGSALDKAVERALSRLETGQKSIERMADGTGSRFEKSVNDAVSRLQSGEKVIKQAVDGAGSSLDKAVEQAIAKLQTGQKTVEKLAQGASGTIDKSVEEAIASLNKLISDSTSTADAVKAAAKELSSQIDRFPEQAGEGASQIRAAINEQIEQLNEMANGAADKAKELSRVLGLHKVEIPAQSAEPAAYASGESQNREWYPQVWQGIENQRGPVRSQEIAADQVDNLAQRLAQRLRPLPGSEEGGSAADGIGSSSEAPHQAGPALSAPRPQGPARIRQTGSGPEQAEPAKPAAAAPSGGEKKSGWRDILKTVDNKAGQDGGADAAKQDAEAARASLRIIETLQAMSIDLDRALEEDPPAELLQRYLDGERNVFARRLTNMAGPQLSDRIKKQYSRESEFRADVNRYIAEFETLMDTVTKQDRENILAETYLTSQTGKVYIILKQALGK